MNVNKRNYTATGNLTEHSLSLIIHNANEFWTGIIANVNVIIANVNVMKKAFNI